MPKKKKVELGIFGKGLILISQLLCVGAFVYAGMLSLQGYGLVGDEGYAFEAKPTYHTSRVFLYRSVSLRDGSLGGPNHRGGGLGGGK